MAVGFSAILRDGSRSEVGWYQTGGLTPAAGLASTARDLAAFASWQFSLLENGDDDILSANTLKEMYRPHFILPGWSVAWGLGFEIENEGGKIYVGHTGTCPGFATRIELEPDSRLGMVILTNANNIEVWHLTRTMHKIMAPAVAAAMKDRAHVTPKVENENTPNLSDYTGLYDFTPFGTDGAIIVWEGELAAIRLSSNNPVREFRRLRHIEGDVFRRIRNDGVLAEAWNFERDKSGKVVRYKWYGDYVTKIP